MPTITDWLMTTLILAPLAICILSVLIATCRDFVMAH